MIRNRAGAVRYAARCGLALAGGLAMMGCGPAVTFRPDPRLVPQPLPTIFRDDDWAAVLRDFVRDGLVDYDGLAARRDPLDRYYALISYMGPTQAPDQFTTRQDRMAYYINAYNALTLLVVLQDPSRATLYDIMMPRYQSSATFQLDRSVITLDGIEDRLRQEAAGDVRVIFALSRAALGGPVLASEPYRGGLLDRQLEHAAAAALDNPFLLQIHHDQHVILVWEEILWRRDEFLAWWEARRRTRPPGLLSVLLDLASPRRREALNSAVGYAIRPMPFDRRLNRWRGPAGAAVLPKGPAS